MKTPNTVIYDLITALSPSEKRYFDLYAKQHQIGSGNKYYQFYQFIKENGVATDDDLRSISSAEPFLAHLPVAKIQLFNNLMNSLSRFHEVDKIQEKVKQEYHQISILIDKGFYKKAASLLKKVRSKVVNYELFYLLDEGYYLYQRIIDRQSYKTVTRAELGNRFTKEAHYAKVKANYNEYWNLFASIYQIHFSDVKTKQRTAEHEMASLFQDPLLKDASLAQSISAQLLFWQLKALQGFLDRNAKEAANNNSNLLQLLEENPKILEQNPRRYLSSLNNYLIDCVMLNRGNDLKAGLDKIRELPAQKAYRRLPETAKDVFRLSYSLEMNFNLSKGGFTQNYKLIDYINGQIQDYKRALPEHQLVAFYYLFAYTCFGLGKFDECLDWTNLIMNETNEKTAGDLQATTRLLHLLAHYEMGNYDLLEYAINNVRRYHKSREKLTALEAEILSSLALLLKTIDTDKVLVFEKLEEKLGVIALKVGEKSLFNNFNYLAWAKSKVQGISFLHSYKLEMV